MSPGQRSAAADARAPVPRSEAGPCGDRHVDRQVEVEARLLEDRPVLQGRDQGTLGQARNAVRVDIRQEALRPHQSVLGMVDARQRLGSRQALSLQVDLGLIPDSRASSARGLRRSISAGGFPRPPASTSDVPRARRAVRGVPSASLPFAATLFIGTTVLTISLRHSVLYYHIRLARDQTPHKICPLRPNVEKISTPTCNGDWHVVCCDCRCQEYPSAEACT